MKLMINVFVFAFVALLSTSNAQALGTVKLTIVQGSTTQVLNVTESGGAFNGTLTTNSVAASVATILSGNSATIYLGSEVSSLDSTLNGEDTSFTGNLGTRSTNITANAKPGDDRYVYDGIVGAFDDFTGKGDPRKLVLFWGKSKLTLEPGTTPGSCTGTIKSGGTVTHNLSCETTGTSFNAFLTNPTAVIYLLVNLLVR